MMKRFFCVLFVLTGFASLAQTNIVGKWKTIDDESGKAKVSCRNL